MKVSGLGTGVGSSVVARPEDSAEQVWISWGRCHLVVGCWI